MSQDAPGNSNQDDFLKRLLPAEAIRPKRPKVTNGDQNISTHLDYFKPNNQSTKSLDITIETQENPDRCALVGKAIEAMLRQYIDRVSEGEMDEAICEINKRANEVCRSLIRGDFKK